MRLLHTRNNGHIDEENPYWISFSDIMAGLLVIFILAAMALIIELQKKQDDFDNSIEELRKSLQVKKSIVIDIKEELEKKNIPVIISENDSVIRIPEEVLTFKQSRFDLPEDEHHQNSALEVGRVLYGAIAKDDRWRYLDTIFIEGHTDSVPFHNRKIKGNWGLSTFRAISVWDHWRSNLPDDMQLTSLRNHEGKNLFSMSGYAETRPNPDTFNLTDVTDIHKKNRRIDIRFTTKRPTLEEYESVKQGAL